MITTARTRGPRDSRIMRRVLVDVDTGCWLWTGALNLWGYGVIGDGTREDNNSLVHRAAYEEFVGPIPDGLDLDHLCRNRMCCNPDHLEPVTRAENVARGDRSTGWADELKTCKRGHPWVEENTRRSAKQRHCRTCERARKRGNRAAEKRTKETR